MEDTKKCSVCKEVKFLSLFNRLSKSKTGRTPSCKVCRSAARNANSKHISAQKKAWYEANKDSILNAAKEDRVANPAKHKEKEAKKYTKSRDKILARVSVYQKNNRSIGRASEHKYRKANPHIGRAKTALRRSKKLIATPSWAASEWEQFVISEIYHLASLRTELVETQVDHIVPLISTTVCGLHCAANLQLLNAFDNASKGNRFWPDMW